MDAKETKATRERLDLNLITLRDLIGGWSTCTRPLTSAQTEAFVRPLIGALASAVDLRRAHSRLLA